MVYKIRRSRITVASVFMSLMMGSENLEASLTDSLSQVMRSLRSLSFFRPAKAILVPGMYLRVETSVTGWNTIRSATYLFRILEILEQRTLVPCETLVDVGSGVRVVCSLSSLATKETAPQSASGSPRCVKSSAYPCKLGPTLWGSPAPTVWHCAQRVLKREAPFLASPVAEACQMRVEW